jgi:predicted lysophospholipase L1 biosynthesis ABC-type transport system permease subunit
MYKKLLKNFVWRNIKIFLLIFFSLSLSLFGYIFSDSLSKNFIQNISQDSLESLWWDIVINIWNKPEEYFKEKVWNILENKNIETSLEYSISSAIETDEITSANITYFSENYPLYGEFDYKKTGTSSWIIISQDLYDSLPDDKVVWLLWEKFNIYGIYEQLPKTVNSFLSTQNIFIQQKYFGDTLANESNALINKKYFLKITDNQVFTETLEQLEEQFSWREIQNYKNWGERFEQIISNLTSYINYAVLFSFFLTVTIIFLSISSFFIKERKQLSILRILGMDSLQVYRFFGILFLLVFIFAYLIAVWWNILVFEWIRTIELASEFVVLNESIFKWAILWIILFLFSFSLPVLKLLSALPNVGLQDNFFNNLSRKEKIILGFSFFWLAIVLGIFLWYSIIIATIIAVIMSILLILFWYFSNKLLKYLFNKSWNIKKKNFFLYDSIRSTVRPGNLSFLLNISFFIIFFVTLFISVLFWNFYNRLQVNLETDNNLFILNITQDTFDQIDKKYQEKAYSLLRWRIIEINNQTLKKHLENNPSWRFSREFNMTDSWLEDLQILRWEKITAGTVSVDNNFSTDLWVNIWDEIKFQIYGLEKTLKVVNIRESRDYSINPFFYFQVDKQEFAKFPKQYFVSDFVDPENIPELKKKFYDLSGGTVNFIEVDKLLEELKEVSKKVLIVIQVLFWYIITFCIAAIAVVGVFYKQFQSQKSYLYFMLGTLNSENKKRIFYEYLFLSLLMLIASIVIVTVWSYYLLSLNDFITFSWMVYWESLLLLLWLFIILVSGIYIFFTTNNSKK